MVAENVSTSMSKLENVSAERLRDELANVSDAKAAKRLMIALAYKDGELVETLSERYGIPMATLYSWLDRFETRAIQDAIADEQRPGRPAKLADGDQKALRDDLNQPPTTHGYEADEWTPELVQTHIDTVYSVTYSVGHVRTILRELASE